MSRWMISNKQHPFGLGRYSGKTMMLGRVELLYGSPGGLMMVPMAPIHLHYTPYEVLQT